MASNLKHSHAHEGSVPGTVDVRVTDGDDAYMGQALFPVPAEDPNDPLQWPNWKKTTILIICSVYSFLSSSTLVGVSVYFTIWSKEFGITQSQASGLVSYPNLAYGFGSLILVPLYLKIGRRPVMLLSLIGYFAGLIGSSRANSFQGLMAARVICLFCSSVCEALPVQLVNDIFFLHERGKRIGYYTVCLSLGSTGPLYAGYMLAGGYSWRLFFYVQAAFAAALFILAFIFVEETLYKRKSPPIAPSPSPSPSPSPINGSGSEIEKEKEIGAVAAQLDSPTTSQLLPPRKSFAKQLAPWSAYDPDVSFFMSMVRPFTYFLVPAVFWVIATYGIYIGLGALAFNYTFPILITAPPYNWSATASGLIAVASAVGYFLGIPLTPLSDILAARKTRKNGGVREAEMRLGVLLPVMIFPPAGLILFGLTAQYQLHWIGYFVGVAMNNWGAYFFFSFTLAYAVDSYHANTSEMLIAMNLGKQAIAFGMASSLLDWILTDGFGVVISGIFASLALVNNLQTITFILFGKRIRIFMANSWIGAFHRRTERRE